MSALPQKIVLPPMPRDIAERLEKWRNENRERTEWADENGLVHIETAIWRLVGRGLDSVKHEPILHDTRPIKLFKADEFTILTRAPLPAPVVAMIRQSVEWQRARDGGPQDAFRDYLMLPKAEGDGPAHFVIIELAVDWFSRCVSPTPWTDKVLTEIAGLDW